MQPAFEGRLSGRSRRAVPAGGPGERRSAPGGHASPRAAIDQRRGALVACRAFAARAAKRRRTSGDTVGRFALKFRVGL